MAPAVSGTKKSMRSKADAKQMRQFATGLRKYVQENAEYVGPKFAEEARKIHYGETPDRHIYGEATPRKPRSWWRRAWTSRRCRRTWKGRIDVSACHPAADQPEGMDPASRLTRLRHDHVVHVHIGRQFPVPGQRIETKHPVFSGWLDRFLQVIA